MHQVTFKGANRTVEAEDGEDLLSLAKRSGLHIDSSCGGNGSCHQCRIVVHEGAPMRNGKPAVARHKRGAEPVYLACQCEVRGNMVIEPAPMNRVTTDHPTATLIGWSVNTPEQPTGPALAVIDPGVKTGGVYTIATTGDITQERAMVPGTEPVVPPEHQRVVLHDRGAELAAGTMHLGAGPRLVLDFTGTIALCGAATVDVPALDTAPHLPGAIDFVEWSPLKVRTVLTTVGDAPPTALSASGVMACVAALFAAGMCSADGRLLESRFTRSVGGKLLAMLVGPADEAQTPHGAILKSTDSITLAQSRLDELMQYGRLLRARLHDLAPDFANPLIVTGEFGTYVTEGFVRALGIWDGAIEFVPHAAALGAARLAFNSR